VQPLLRSLCCGVGEPELMAAVSGLLAGSAAVRASTLTALPHVPTLAEGLPPESGKVLAVMALARHDADEDNAAAAEALWTQVRACTCISMRGVAALCWHALVLKARAADICVRTRSLAAVIIRAH
jgi:hypothetical protein